MTLVPNSYETILRDRAWVLRDNIALSEACLIEHREEFRKAKEKYFASMKALAKDKAELDEINQSLEFMKSGNLAL